MNQLYVLAAVFFLQMFGYNLGQNFLSLHTASFLSVGETSLLVFVIYFALAFTSLFSGTFIEKSGTVNAIRIGALLYAPFLVLLAFSTSFPLLLCGAVLVGIGGSFFWNGGDSFVLHGCVKRGKSVGIYKAATTAGIALAGIVGALFAAQFGVPALFILGAMLVVSAVLTTFPLEDCDGAVHNFTLRDQLAMFRDHGLVALCVLAMLNNIMFGMIVPLFPLIIKSLGGGAFEVGLAFFGFSMVGVLLMVFGGIKSDKYGRKILFKIALLISALAAFTVYASSDYLLLLIGVFAYSIIRNVMIVGLSAAVGDLFKERIAMANAALNLVGTFGVCIGAALSGVVGGLDVRLPFLVLGGAMLLSLLFVRRLEIR